jgi:hypothetical protein
MGSEGFKAFHFLFTDGINYLYVQLNGQNTVYFLSVIVYSIF